MDSYIIEDSSSVSSKDGELPTYQATPTPLCSRRFPGKVRRTNKVFKPFTPPRFVLETGNSTIQGFAVGLSTPLAAISLSGNASAGSNHHTFRSGTLGLRRIRKPALNFDTNSLFGDHYSFDRPPIRGVDLLPVTSIKRFHLRNIEDKLN